jgi:hypothetical protein
MTEPPSRFTWFCFGLLAYPGIHALLMKIWETLKP